MSKDEIDELTKDEKLHLVNTGHLFCIRTFLVGLVRKFINFIFETILSAEALVFAAFSVAFFMETLKTIFMWITYGVIAIVFIIAKPLKNLINEKTTLNINAEAKVGASAALNVAGDLNKAADQIIEGVKK